MYLGTLGEYQFLIRQPIRNTERSLRDLLSILSILRDLSLCSSMSISRSDRQRESAYTLINRAGQPPNLTIIASIKISDAPSYIQVVALGAHVKLLTLG